MKRCGIWVAITVVVNCSIFLQKLFCCFSGAQTYVITIRSDDTDANVPSEVITSQLSATVEAFSSGTIYSFNVRAINFEGRSSRPSTPAVGTTCKCNVVLLGNNLQEHPVSYT